MKSRVRKTGFVLMLLAFLLMVSCSDQPSKEPTITPVPTWTSMPTQTLVPTRTPGSAWTSTPTWTPAPTWTLAPTWTPAPTSIPCNISDGAIVLVRFGGQESVSLSQVMEIRMGDDRVLTSVLIETERGTYSGREDLQPGPDFCALAEKGFLPKGFLEEQWPAPLTLTVYTDTLQLTDGADTSVVYSERGERALVSPMTFTVTSECTSILWDYDENLGPLASQWEPPSLIGWKDDGWYGRTATHLPYEQRCCRAWPQELWVSFGGWDEKFTLVNLTLEIQDPSTVEVTPESINMGTQTYLGPWGSFMATYLTIDGGATWQLFPSCPEGLKIEGRGWALEVSCD